LKKEERKEENIEASSKEGKKSEFWVDAASLEEKRKGTRPSITLNRWEKRGGPARPKVGKEDQSALQRGKLTLTVWREPIIEGLTPKWGGDAPPREKSPFSPLIEYWLFF